jgi:Nucleotidyl transferase AbiEii toxin, Type IV TA system
MLREDTQAIWDALKGRPELNGFVLIGGTGLALRIGHRRSEDLDFGWPHGNLPREALHQLSTSVPGATFVLDQDPGDLRDADDCNLDLADRSQNFQVNDVRVTFFKADSEEAALLGGHPSDPLRVAEVSEIFALKALVSG